MIALMRLIANRLPWHAARSSPIQIRTARPAPRRSKARTPQFGPTEALEGRALMAVTGVTPFATMTGTITSTNQTSQVSFQITPGEITDSQSAKALIGFVAAPADGSAVRPQITKITATPTTLASQDVLQGDGQLRCRGVSGR